MKSHISAAVAVAPSASASSATTSSTPQPITGSSSSSVVSSDSSLSGRASKRKEMQIFLRNIFKPRYDVDGKSEEVLNTVVDTNDAIDLQNAAANNYAKGDPERARELLQYARDAMDGELQAIKHDDSYYRLQGGDNYNNVSCYIDALLVAMFARLESFEPILYRTDDPSVEGLATALRMYVNMLRTGKFLSTDLTSALLDVFISAGWLSDRRHKKTRQQDASELFTFITDKLNMPLLTLRMDIAHGGKEDAEDDHKLVHESMLLLSVPGDTDDEPLLLEECLENYFANSVQVTRQYEQYERRKTIDSTTADPSGRKFSLTLSSRRDSIASKEELDMETTTAVGSDDDEDDEDDEGEEAGDVVHDIRKGPQLRKNSRASTSSDIKKEIKESRARKLFKRKRRQSLWTNGNKITVPAWMFYQLLPFYTDSIVPSSPSTKASPIAQHFANTRPVLVMCLKRYSFSPARGSGQRNGRHVIVPETIHLPSFVADEADGADEAKVFGNFKLVLESAVFHRGALNEGHYIALVNEDPYSGYDEPKKSFLKRIDDHEPKPLKKSGGMFSKNGKHKGKAAYGSTPRRWLLYDDLKTPKFRAVDLETTFDKECPYLLFYRMVQVDKDGYDVPFKKEDKIPTLNVPEEEEKAGKLSNLLDLSELLFDKKKSTSPRSSTEGRRSHRSFLSAHTTPRNSLDGKRRSTSTAPNSPRSSMDKKWLKPSPSNGTGGRHSLDIQRPEIIEPEQFPPTPLTSHANSSLFSLSRKASAKFRNGFKRSSSPSRISTPSYTHSSQSSVTSVTGSASTDEKPRRRKIRDKYREEKCSIM